MSMRQCPVCHERYSDTYKTCPFCEETAALQKGKKLRRRGGKRVARSGFDPTGAIITLLVLVILGTSVYFIFGDTIAKTFGIRDNPSQQEQENQLAPGKQDDPSQTPEDNDPSDPEPVPDPTPDEPEDPTPSAPATAVALEKNDISVSETLGLSAQLKVSGGSGTYTWSTSNSSIVTVTGSGIVTGIAKGTATVTVTDGYTSASCIVRVR